MRTILLLGVAVVLPLIGAEPTFQAVDVDTKVEIGYGLAIADVNGDKKPDILLADKNLIVWYENPAWTKHIIAEKLTTLDHVCIAAADLDGDGKAEVAAGAGWNPGDTLKSGAVFYLMPPADRTQKWEPIQLQHEPTVHRMRWVNGDLVVVPLHGRGNKGGQGAGVKIIAYKKPADPKQPWQTELLDETLHMTHNFDPVQWDSDPELELLVGGKEGVFLLNDKKFTQLAGGDHGGAGEVRMGKLSSGKRFFATVEPMHGTTLAVYTQTGGDQWTRKALDSSLADGHALGCGDVAKAGSDQILVGWRAMGKPGVKVGIKMFTAQDSEGKEWKETLVDDNKMACEDLMLADLNADGRLDIVAAGRATKNLKIYWNGAR
jgi:hypothetical protein